MYNMPHVNKSLKVQALTAAVDSDKPDEMEMW